MVKVSLIKPLDQPPGTRRLLDDLKIGLVDPRFANFRMIVAYAKSGPLHRLEPLLRAWRLDGKNVSAIFGIDQQGTSKEALVLAMTLFDTVYITNEPSITFHPKIYVFSGVSHVHAFIGSNNLTVGGTEKNFESCIHLELDLPGDATTAADLEDAWSALLPLNCSATKVLDANLLAQYVADGTVIGERAMRTRRGRDDDASVGATRRAVRSGLVIKPESPLPRKSMGGRPESPAATTNASGAPPLALTRVETARGLAIQIRPHHNGEIFLSVTAALQNPSFLKWPFSGLTTPKKVGNPSYPQLIPDPVVNIVVYGARAGPLLTLNSYLLNTVYYETKSEIRITASPLIGVAPEFSVMIIENSETENIDYEITIHTPESPDYAAWIEACNQTMPGGGQTPRRFGWF
jgi:hypothetical protein